jgi:hypothetical protein
MVQEWYEWNYDKFENISKHQRALWVHLVGRGSADDMSGGADDMSGSTDDHPGSSWQRQRQTWMRLESL